jgi:hypothetical protein
MSESDVNKPVSDADVDQFIRELSDADKQELRRQQLVAKAVNREAPKAEDFGRMTSGEFRRKVIEEFGFDPGA